eukprot:TRINITY_DN47539_c0_g1_i2.p1 TRINITY_DN47539_c0_g1~~TRINITY_DN47539_c0_g1_i2.p1  ORF type:complete len:542 (+),score=60.37 TRINITY_DN47539_c0_g1_i2:19-1644(+)
MLGDSQIETNPALQTSQNVSQKVRQVNIIPPKGCLLFQKILPQISLQEKKLRFNNQEHVLLVNKICNGELTKNKQAKLKLCDERGKEFIVVVNILNGDKNDLKEEGLMEMVFTIGSLIDIKGLTRGDRLLFYSMGQPHPNMLDFESNCVRMRIKRGTCHRCKTRDNQGLIGCCLAVCDKAYHLICAGIEKVPQYWVCPDCTQNDQQSNEVQASSSDDEDDDNQSSSEKSESNTSDKNNQSSQRRGQPQGEADDAESTQGHPLPASHVTQKVSFPSINLQRAFEAYGSQMANKELIDPPMCKECVKCKQVKQRRDFFRSYFSLDGLQPYCRTCKNFTVFDGEIGFGAIGVQYQAIGRLCVNCKAVQPNECFVEEMCETCLRSGSSIDQGIVDWEEKGLEEQEGVAKKCLKCFKVRRLDMYWHNSGTKDGFDSRCKICKTLAKKKAYNSKRKRTFEEIQAERERGRAKRLQKPPHIKDEQDFKQEVQLLSDLNSFLTTDIRDAIKSCERAMQTSKIVLQGLLKNEPADVIFAKIQGGSQEIQS